MDKPLETEHSYLREAVHLGGKATRAGMCMGAPTYTPRTQHIKKKSYYSDLWSNIDVSHLDVFDRVGSQAHSQSRTANAPACLTVSRLDTSRVIRRPSWPAKPQLHWEPQWVHCGAFLQSGQTSLLVCFHFRKNTTVHRKFDLETQLGDCIMPCLQKLSRALQRAAKVQRACHALTTSTLRAPNGTHIRRL